MAYIGNTSVTTNVQPATDFFSGNGVTTAFTLSRSVISSYTIEAVINNVQQNPSSAYSVSGNIITFTSAPPSGTNNIYVNYNSIQGQTVGIGQGTVGSAQISTGGPTWDVNGNVVVGGNLALGNINPTSRVESVSSNNTIANTAGTQFKALRFSASDTPVSNTDFLEITNTRTATGPSWTTRGWRIQQKVDATHMGWMQFNANGNTGGISFGTGLTPTSPTAVPEVAKIDSVGRMTVPNMPFVSLYPQNTVGGTIGSTDGSVMVQLSSPTWLTIVDQVGGHWNGSQFTCPVAGMYQISISGIKYPAAGVLHVDLRVNNVAAASGNARTRAEETSSYNQFGSTYIIRCQANDAISWHAFGGAGFHGGHGIWSIRLVG